MINTYVARFLLEDQVPNFREGIFFIFLFPEVYYSSVSVHESLIQVDDENDFVIMMLQCTLLKSVLHFNIDLHIIDFICCI